MKQDIDHLAPIFRTPAIFIPEIYYITNILQTKSIVGKVTELYHITKVGKMSDPQPGCAVWHGFVRPGSHSVHISKAKSHAYPTHTETHCPFPDVW